MAGNRISAAAFDLDGTLVDLERLHHEAHLRAARDGGVALTWDQARDQLPHFIGGPDARVAAEVAALAPGGVSPAEVMAAKQRYFSALVGGVGEIVPRKGVGEILDRLEGGGIPVAVGTATERDPALVILRRAGLLRRFGEDRVVSAQDVPRLKPAPDVYRETARRLGAPPEDQLVFEDSVTGMASARSAGSPVVAMPTVHDRDYLSSVAASGALAVFPDWHDERLLSLLDQLLVPVAGPLEVASRRRGIRAFPYRRIRSR